MAKVRIQARSEIAENPTGDDKFPLGLHGSVPPVGALDILARVWRTQGLTGWYQVSENYCALSYDKLKCVLVGDAGTNYKSSFVTGPVVHVKRTI
jgi:hypothetical protein